MRLKSFFADSIEDALRQARHELGPETMLVDSKRTNAEARHLGAYEVVVCTESPEYGREDPQRKRPLPTSEAAFPVDQISREVSQIKQQVEKLAVALARSGSGRATTALDTEFSRAFLSLVDAEFDAQLAFDIVSRLRAPFSGENLRAELVRLVPVEPGLERPDGRSRIVAFAGPPGAGKTSALVKLAVQYGVATQRPVQILTSDTYRIGAAEELRSYAAILGIGFQVLDSPAALRPALQECSHKDLIVIDTAGLARSEMEIAEEWAAALSANPEIDTHLVLPASMRAADMQRIANQYLMFQPQKLLFTRLDETETLGPILSLSIRMHKPLSFFSWGQRIPEDLAQAELDGLLDRILGEGPSISNETPEARAQQAQYGVVAA